MKTLKLFILFAACSLQSAVSFAQCLPLVKIDGNYVVADENNVKGLKLPLWLKTGQTLAKDQYVYSISVIEFSVNGSALDYSQNLSITTVQTVPANKVWKVESIVKDMSMPNSSTGVTYSVAGTYTFTSPSCITVAYIQVWGAGGGGSNNYVSNAGGNGGGAGGYTEGSYQLPASTNYAITVGAGGTPGTSNNAVGNTGGSSSIGTLGLSATGGSGGTNPSTCACSAAAGTGSGGQMNLTGQTGYGYGGPSNFTGGSGGTAPYNGGIGGIGASSGLGSAGGFGAGGAGGGAISNSDNDGGIGGAGKVQISFGNSSGSGSSGSTTLTPKVPCAVMYLRCNQCTTSAACPSGWTEVDNSNANEGSAWNGIRTCMRCD